MEKEFEKVTSVKCTKKHFAKKGKSKKIAGYDYEVMQNKELRLLAQYMRKHHANLTEEGKDLGKTALHIEIIEYLLEKGVDINATTKDGSTVLHIAARYCNFEIVQHLIEKGADVNARDNKGNTPLHIAAQEREYENKQKKLYVVQYLVNNGANINVKNNDGKTALDIATDCDVTQYLNLLIN